MKKTMQLTITIFFTIAVLAGCQNIFTGKPNSLAGGGEALPDGYGALRVSFARGTARTAMPDEASALFDLEFIFTNEETGDVEKQQPGNPNNNIYTIILPEGKYSLLIKAWKKGSTQTDDKDLIADGSADNIIIIAGETNNPVTKITLHPKVSEGGTGTLQFTLTYNTPPANADFDLGAFTLSPIFGDEPPIDVLGLPEFTNGTTIAMNKTYTVNVPTGYYTLSMTLVKMMETTVSGQSVILSSFASKSEVVHIYQNLETAIEYVFTDITFIENIVANTLDSYKDEFPIPGSLRYAINNASGLAVPTTIRVMLPQGSEIKLKSSLEINTNADLVIEGNGIILSKGDEPWGLVDFNRLMTIWGSSVPAHKVTIRRFHFKDSAGAIENNGNLSLESCIFNNNTTLSSGGAIYNNNDGKLAVKGCTFYNNQADDQGGAIYNHLNGEIDELTGNLFLGNTARDEKVISNDASKTVTSGGYNVVFTEEDGYKCDWIPNSSDKEIPSTTVPFSPKTFRLFSGSQAADITFDPPSNYPKKDFYGDPVEADIHAGAVQKTITGGFYLDLDKGLGDVTVSPAPADFIYTSGTSVTLTAKPLAVGNEFEGWQVNGEPGSPNKSLVLKMDSDKKVKAIFTLPPVSSLKDESGSLANMTLRYALSVAKDDDVIKFRDGLVTPGESVISLARPLPQITKNNITIEGGGITLTPEASYSTDFSSYESMISVGRYTNNVTINKVHFKDGKGFWGGAAISNNGDLTIKSCIFSNNTASDDYGWGGAIHNYGSLDVKGCTFYNNKAGLDAGAISNSNDSGIKLTGNLFYNNSADTGWPILHNTNPSITPSCDYNAVDVPFGTANNESGWAAGTGDQSFTSGVLIDSITFKPLLPALNSIVPSSVLSDDFPTTDFYGNPRNFPGAPGAVNGD